MQEQGDRRQEILQRTVHRRMREAQFPSRHQLHLDGLQLHDLTVRLYP